MSRLKPVEEAAAVYEREWCARSFREDLEAHLLNGYVFNTPSAFVMGRPVRRDADAGLIVNPHYVFPREEWDCWLLYLYAGNVGEAFAFEPFYLPWIGFERGNVLRFYRTERVRGKVSVRTK